VLASLINAGIGNPLVVLLIAVAVGAASACSMGCSPTDGASFITLGTLSLFAASG
jgi:ribose transport system permease protein